MTNLLKSVSCFVLIVSGCSGARAEPNIMKCEIADRNATEEALNQSDVTYKKLSSEKLLLCTHQTTGEVIQFAEISVRVDVDGAGYHRLSEFVVVRDGRASIPIENRDHINSLVCIKGKVCQFAKEFVFFGGIPADEVQIVLSAWQGMENRLATGSADFFADSTCANPKLDALNISDRNKMSGAVFFSCGSGERWTALAELVGGEFEISSVFESVD